MNRRIMISVREKRDDDAIHLSLTVSDDETFHAIFRSIPELKRQFPEIRDVRSRVRNPFIAPHQIALAILLVGAAMAKGAAQKIGADVYRWLRRKFKGKITRKSERPALMPKKSTKEITKKPTMGAHWETTNYPVNYQLSRRVEDVAVELSKRQKKGWQPLRMHVEELYEISYILKGLELKPKR